MPTIKEFVQNFGWMEAILSLATIIIIVYLRERPSFKFFRRSGEKKNQ